MMSWANNNRVSTRQLWFLNCEENGLFVLRETKYEDNFDSCRLTYTSVYAYKRNPTNSHTYTFTSK